MLERELVTVSPIVRSTDNRATITLTTPNHDGCVIGVGCVVLTSGITPRLFVYVASDKGKKETGHP